MNPDFEKQLQEQPIRELPRAWRSEILAAASANPRANFTAWIATWLWPYPRAWAGLATTWGIIFILHFTTPDEPGLARASWSITPGSFALMQQQTLMMAQLLNTSENDSLSPAPPATPKPRSERAKQQRIV